MSPTFPKKGRVRLKKDEYKALVHQILERDDWTCRRCPSRQNLEVHHITKRSAVRIDQSWNLCTLCSECHELVERHKVDIIGSDADLLPPAVGFLRFEVRS